MNSDSEPNHPMGWEPHEHPNFDEILETGCATEIQRLVAANSLERLRFVKDPREVHGRLYASLTPQEHPEYAGTYRGTPGTTLEWRRIGVYRADDDTFQEFIAPQKVSHYMDSVGDQAEKIFYMPSGTCSSIVISEIVKLFYIFGLIHPFLDGNGHIQRLIFVACVMERDSLQLSNAWTIHPRPYDIEIKAAFEASTFNARITALRDVLVTYVA